MAVFRNLILHLLFSITCSMQKLWPKLEARKRLEKSPSFLSLSPDPWVLLTRQPTCQVSPSLFPGNRSTTGYQHDQPHSSEGTEHYTYHHSDTVTKPTLIFFSATGEQQDLAKFVSRCAKTYRENHPEFKVGEVLVALLTEILPSTPSLCHLFVTVRVRTGLWGKANSERACHHPSIVVSGLTL